MKKSIIKYLTGKISNKEFEKLKEWLSNSENVQEFKQFVRFYYLLNRSSEANLDDKAYDKILSSIQEDTKLLKSKTIQLKSWMRYAIAASIVLFSSMLFFNKDTFNNTDIEQKNQLVTGTSKAILTLEDGSNVVLEKGAAYTKGNLNSTDTTLVYKKTSGIKKGEVLYNYLTVPRGGEFFVLLSDSTKVWLNSESKIKYPKQFIKGESRRVELVYGEAYFDVSSSKNHNGDSFKVLSKGQHIDVLGTHFNVKAYKDENYIYTTLVEGKIKLSANDYENILKPNEQAVFSLKSGTVEVNKIDVGNEISWKEGLFSFKGKNLKDIMTVLSRWYNVEFVFENENIKDLTFRGVLGKNQSIEEILNNIKSTSVITDYEIYNNKIIIR